MATASLFFLPFPSTLFGLLQTISVLLGLAILGVRVREKVPGSGVWWVYVYAKGRRAAKRVGDKRTANKFAKLMREQLSLGKPSAQSRTPTVSQFYKGFKKTYLRSAVKETTRDSYEQSFRIHILPELGNLRLDEVSRPRMEEFVAHLVGKRFGKHKDSRLSKDSIRLILAALGVLYSQAIEHGLVAVNPTRNLGKFYRNAPTKNTEIQPLTPKEVEAFLHAVIEHSPQHYALFLTAVHSGVRSAELAGLQWSDLDWSNRYVTVRRNFVNGRVTTTKTDRVRRVDLSDAVIEALIAHRKAKRKEWLKKGQNEIPAWIFGNSAGKPADMRNLKRRHFKRVLKKAGLRQIRFHDLRHTYATLLIQQGESLAYVRDQLGHSTIKMTVDTYTHWIPGSNRQAVNRLPKIEIGVA